MIVTSTVVPRWPIRGRTESMLFQLPAVAEPPWKAARADAAITLPQHMRASHWPEKPETVVILRLLFSRNSVCATVSRATIVPSPAGLQARMPCTRPPSLMISIGRVPKATSSLSASMPSRW